MSSSLNFWNSSHSHSLLEYSKLLNILNIKNKEMNKIYKKNENCFTLLLYFYSQKIFEIVKSLKAHVIIASTACTYFKRYYILNNDINNINPEILVACSILLSVKTNECPIKARDILSITKKKILCDCDLNELLEAELSMVVVLNFKLKIFTSYSNLEEYINDSKLFNIKESAHDILNDMYISNVSLIYEPYIIAMASIFMAAVISSEKIDWFVGLNLNFQRVWDAVLMICDFYECMSKKNNILFECLSNLLWFNNRQKELQLYKWNGPT